MTGIRFVLARSIKVRLAGIDAPESYQRCVDGNGAEYECGWAATRHLKQIIGDEEVGCKLHTNDRYGRFLMTCYKSDGTDIHAQMVRDGYAVVSTYEPYTYLNSERYARYNKRGMWRGTFRHPYCHRHKKNWRVQNLCNDNKNYTGWEPEKYISAK